MRASCHVTEWTEDVLVNARDFPGSDKGLNWGMPEYLDTVNLDESGDLGLSDKDEDAIESS